MVGSLLMMAWHYVIVHYIPWFVVGGSVWPVGHYVVFCFILCFELPRFVMLLIYSTQAACSQLGMATFCNDLNERPSTARWKKKINITTHQVWGFCLIHATSSLKQLGYLLRTSLAPACTGSHEWFDDPITSNFLSVVRLLL